MFQRARESGRVRKMPGRPPVFMRKSSRCNEQKAEQTHPGGRGGAAPLMPIMYAGHGTELVLHQA